MCKIEGVSIGIKKLDFNSYKGKFAVYLTDGRIVVVPVSMFPGIQKLSLEKRNTWMIMDDQFFTFDHVSEIYPVTDVLKYS